VVISELRNLRATQNLAQQTVESMKDWVTLFLNPDESVLQIGLDILQWNRFLNHLIVPGIVYESHVCLVSLCNMFT